jgi:hypothetical protein
LYLFFLAENSPFVFDPAILQSQPDHHQGIVLGPQWFLPLAEAAGEAQIQMAELKNRGHADQCKLAWILDGLSPEQRGDPRLNYSTMKIFLAISNR